jgi:hypothetical protein
MIQYIPKKYQNLIIGISALESGIKDLQNLLKEHEANHNKKCSILKSFKYIRELHSSAREMQLYLEKSKGVHAQKPEIKLRERIKR